MHLLLKGQNNMIKDGKLQLITQALTKASRFMSRDFLELESMQSSNKKNYEFINRSSKKLAESLSEELHKLQIKLLFSKTDLIEYHNWVKTQKHIGHGAIRALMVSVLDGADNLLNAIPFFSTTITSLLWNDKNEICADMAAIHFPALGELFYAQQGRGAFRERFIGNSSGASKMRVSGNVDQKDIIIASSLDNMNVARNFSDNIRIFECDSYLLSLFVSGKLDMAILKGGISSYAHRLFIKEAGGFIVDKRVIQFKSSEITQALQNEGPDSLDSVIRNSLIASNR